MMSAPVSATGSSGATGWAGWPCSRASGRRTRTRRPSRTRHRPGRLPKVTSSQSTSAARDRASSSGYRSPPPYSPSDPNAAGATWMTRILTVSLGTLGDPGRLTGGYRYHRRMAELAPTCGAVMHLVSFPERPFTLSTLAGPAHPRERIRVVPPGHDLPAAHAGPPVDLRRGRRAGLLCVANWVQRKGIHERLQAVARLPDGLA